MWTVIGLDKIVIKAIQYRIWVYCNWINSVFNVRIFLTIVQPIDIMTLIGFKLTSDDEDVERFRGVWMIRTLPGTSRRWITMI